MAWGGVDMYMAFVPVDRVDVVASQGGLALERVGAILLLLGDDLLRLLHRVLRIMVLVRRVSVGWFGKVVVCCWWW